MADLDLTAAIEAAIKAVHTNASHDGIDVPYCGGAAPHQKDDGEAAVRAAAPLIAAQVREHIAHEIRNVAEGYQATLDGMHAVVMDGEPHAFGADDLIRYAAYASAWDNAARRIARGGAR